MCTLVIVSHQRSSTRQLHRNFQQWPVGPRHVADASAGPPPRLVGFPIKLSPQNCPSMCHYRFKQSHQLAFPSSTISALSHSSQLSSYRIPCSSLQVSGLSRFLLRPVWNPGVRARVCVCVFVCGCACVFFLGDGDSVVCAVRDTPEPVSVQGGRADSRSGSVPDHGYCGVASGRSDLVLQAPEGASYHAPPHSRRVPSCRQCHPILNRRGHQSGHEPTSFSCASNAGGLEHRHDWRERDTETSIFRCFKCTGFFKHTNTTEVDDWSWNVGSTYDSNSLSQCKNDTQGALYGIFLWVLI